MSSIRYPDPGQYRRYTPPATPTSRRGQVRHVAGILLAVAVGLGLAYLFLRLLGGPPPEWLRWAALALPLVWLWYARRRERRKNQQDRPDAP